MRALLVIASILLTGSATARAKNVCNGFLPANDLHKYDKVLMNNEIDKEVFNEIITKVDKVYAPIVESHGAKLSWNRLWENPTVNASAQQMGNTWMVNMYGGLARRPETTPDGFAMVICHELGHHLAGFPFYGNRDWAASEGQSDYFATQACARMIWANENNYGFEEGLDPVAIAKCDQNFAAENDKNLCYRTAKASQSLADLLATLGGSGKPKFGTPDPKVVSSTLFSHPAAQCRLDTYMAGSLCKKPFDKSIIPGKGHPQGNNSLAAERIASEYSCMEANDDVKDVVRPRCWFAPGAMMFLEFIPATDTFESSGSTDEYSDYSMRR